MDQEKHRINNKKYRDLHKDQISHKKRFDITTCNCGSVVTTNHIARHNKTVKHQQYTAK